MYQHTKFLGQTVMTTYVFYRQFLLSKAQNTILYLTVSYGETNHDIWVDRAELT
jgi:hypothetical protein